MKLKFQKVLDQDGVALYCPDYDQQFTMEELLQDISWRNDSITMFGKTHPQPRMTAWHGDPGIIYTYSRITMETVVWSRALLELKNRLEKDLQCSFNSVLVNYYRDGDDHMSWHSDNEKSLGKNPVIASLSYGAERLFQFRHKRMTPLKTVDLILENGSLLLMQGNLQENWNHRVAKTKKVKTPRLNLTYRYVYQ